MVAMPIMVQASVKPAVPKAGSTNRRARERTIVYEGSAGPRELMESLVIQATAALKGLEGLRTTLGHGDGTTGGGEMTEEQKRVTTESKSAKGKHKESNIFVEENVKLFNFW